MAAAVTASLTAAKITYGCWRFNPTTPANKRGSRTRDTNLTHWVTGSGSIPRQQRLQSPTSSSLLHRKETSDIPYSLISPSQELLIITNSPSPALPILQHTLMHPSLAAKRNSSPLFGVHPIPQPYKTKLSHPTAASPPSLILLFRMFW